MRARALLPLSSLPVLPATFLLAGCFATNPDWEPPDPSLAVDTTGASDSSTYASGSSGDDPSAVTTGTSDASDSGSTADVTGTSGSDLLCADISDLLESKKPDILFVLDKSASMLEGWGDGMGPTRWESLYSAMGVATEAVDESALLGVTLFPGTEVVEVYGIDGCYVDDAPYVPVNPLNTADTIMEALPKPGLDDDLLVGGTPAGEAIRVAREHLLARQTGQMQFIVLVTDGVANCSVDCDEQNNFCLFEQSDPQLLNEVELALSQGIATIVVGVEVKDMLTPVAEDGQPDAVNPAELLNQIALAGGVADLKDGSFLDASDPDSLDEHLTFLTEFLTPCHLAPTKELDDVDPYNGSIEVKLNGDTVPLVSPESCFGALEPGWTWIDDETGSAVLCGPACFVYQTLIEQGEEDPLEILYCVEE